MIAKRFVQGFSSSYLYTTISYSNINKIYHFVNENAHLDLTYYVIHKMKYQKDIFKLHFLGKFHIFIGILYIELYLTPLLSTNTNILHYKLLYIEFIINILIIYSIISLRLVIE